MLYKNIVLTLLLSAATAQYTIAADAADTKAFNQAFSNFQKFSEKGQWRKTEPHARKAYEMGKTLFGSESKNTAVLAHNYGVTLIKLNRRDKAKTVLLDALEIHENVYGKDAEELVPVLLDLADALNRGADADLKAETLNRVMDITTAIHGKDSAVAAQRALEIGIKLQTKDTLKESQKLIKQGYEGLLASLGANSSRVHYAAFQLAKVELSSGNTKAAIKHLNEALAGATASESASPELEIASRNFLLRALEKQGKRKEATEHIVAVAIANANGANADAKNIIKHKMKLASKKIKEKSGSILVSFTVDAEGFVKDPKVVSMEGSSLQENAAFQALKKFRYFPAVKNGEAVASSGIEHTFKYKIK